MIVLKEPVPLDQWSTRHRCLGCEAVVSLSVGDFDYARTTHLTVTHYFPTTYSNFVRWECGFCGTISKVLIPTNLVSQIAGRRIPMKPCPTCHGGRKQRGRWDRFTHWLRYGECIECEGEGWVLAT